MLPKIPTVLSTLDNNPIYTVENNPFYSAPVRSTSTANCRNVNTARRLDADDDERILFGCSKLPDQTPTSDIPFFSIVSATRRESAPSRHIKKKQRTHICIFCALSFPTIQTDKQKHAHTKHLIVRTDLMPGACVFRVPAKICNHGDN